MISVIIPVYNGERYLGRCLDSVLGSACRDFEVIVVDNASTDGSRQLALAYTKRDERVKVIFQAENQGVSAARNRGIEASSGEWIVFVDADDQISPDFLGLIAEEDADLLLFDFAGPEGAGSPPRRRLRYSKGEMICLFRELLRSGQLVENGNVNLASANARAFRRSVIDRYGLRFSPALSYGEDLVFTMAYQLKAASCVYRPVPVYRYHIHGDSSSRRFVSAESVRARWERIEKMKSVLEEGGIFPLVEEDYDGFVLRTMSFLILRLLFSPQCALPAGERRQLCREIHDNPVLQQTMRRNRGGPPDSRLVIFLFRMGWYPALRLLGRYSCMRLRRKNPQEFEEMRKSGWYR